ncbi:tRNA modification GTPase [gamma proteobacterium HdN1]|nr:tRNA modification GTPase [gamma proteobacterium HdN1]
MSSTLFRNDTIAAQATPPGRGGVGIVRLSGPEALSIGLAICLRSGVLQARHAYFSEFFDAAGNVLDHGLLLYFPSPHSFTGEDVIELQAHGGPFVISQLMDRAITLGARLARPGEFSERAFHNDKLDLAQAEAIADLIDSGSEQAARSAIRSLQGAFSIKINEFLNELIRLRVFVEAAIDFPEEEIDFLSDGRVQDQLNKLLAHLDAIFSEAKRGVLLKEGMRVVLAGKPNAGKSSLLNQLAGTDRAIVTPIAGTTRDVLHEHIHLDGMPLHISDTAGLRESADEVEQEGIRRAWQEIERADRILLLTDASEHLDLHPAKFWPEFINTLHERAPSAMNRMTIVRNKIDLADEAAGQSEHDNIPTIRLCARSGQGVDLLREHLKQIMGYEEPAETTFSARQRHLLALETAREFLVTGQQQLLSHGAGELLAEDLRAAQEQLSTITGQFTSDDLLGEIFSSFCIGK